MRCRLALTLTVSLAFLARSLAGPIIVKDGTGGSEYNLVLASNHLSELASNCLADCGLSQSQLKTLTTLIARSSSPPSFRFAMNPGAREFFRWVDATGVEFNQSALWQDDGASVPFDLAAATSVWIQILSERPSVLPMADVSVIRAALVTQLRSRLLSATWTRPVSGGERFDIETVRGITGSDHVIATDERNAMIDLTDDSLKAAATQCDGGDASVLHVLSLRVLGDESQAAPSVSFELVARWRCGADVVRARIRHQVPTVRDSKGRWILDTKNLQSFVTGE